MKKTLLIALAAIATIFTSCSSDINNDNDDLNNGQGKGMTLIANVEQDDTRATLDTKETFGTWSFAYTDKDDVKVGNDKIDTYYKFTKNGDKFSCADAQTTKTNANWYAYYPGTEINLVNQEGTEASAAALYALAGATETATTGADGLTINMKAQAAVLRIVKVDNYGPCDIYLKTANGEFVSGLKAKKNEAGFDVETSTEKVSVFKKEGNNSAGIYYVIVPAGVKISVYNTNEENHIKTTKAAGLKAGKYYTLTSGPTTGTAEAMINGEKKTIDWVQLWIGGPRFATKNVGEMTWHDATKIGKDFAWGEKWCIPSKADIEPFVKLSEDYKVWWGKSEIKKDGYPTFEFKTDTQQGYNYVQITGYEPGYNKNTLYLYNKISDGNNNYNFWTSDQSPFKPDCGCEFQITEQDGIIGAFGISNLTYKDIKVLTRPILTTQTVLWENRYVNK